MSLLIPLPVNKTGAMSKKKQTTLAAGTRGGKKINRFPHWWVFTGQTILSGVRLSADSKGLGGGVNILLISKFLS